MPAALFGCGEQWFSIKAGGVHKGTCSGKAGQMHTMQWWFYCDLGVLRIHSSLLLMPLKLPHEPTDPSTRALCLGSGLKLC